MFLKEWLQSLIVRIALSNINSTEKNVLLCGRFLNLKISLTAVSIFYLIFNFILFSRRHLELACAERGKIQLSGWNTLSCVIANSAMAVNTYEKKTIKNGRTFAVQHFNEEPSNP